MRKNCTAILGDGCRQLATPRTHSAHGSVPILPKRPGSHTRSRQRDWGFKEKSKTTWRSDSCSFFQNLRIVAGKSYFVFTNATGKNDERKEPTRQLTRLELHGSDSQKPDGTDPTAFTRSYSPRSQNYNAATRQNLSLENL